MNRHLSATDRDQIIQQRLKEREEVKRQLRLQSWPTSCPVCFMGPGESCITLRGKRALRHKDRPARQ